VQVDIFFDENLFDGLRVAVARHCEDAGRILFRKPNDLTSLGGCSTIGDIAGDHEDIGRRLTIENRCEFILPTVNVADAEYSQEDLFIVCRAEKVFPSESHCQKFRK
jgi:hypothetical protein